MSRSNASIDAVIDPIRNRYLKSLTVELEAYKASEDSCETEYVRRDDKGVIIRDGVLNLPSRADFCKTSDRTTTVSDLQPNPTIDFEPVDVRIDDKLGLTVFPFSWDEVPISFETGDDPKRLLRLRLWYLEWFQSRRTVSNNTLGGVVHALRGPKHDGDVWQVCIDMGSAPTEALTELFHALASRGVHQMTLGSELDRVEKQES